MTTAITLDSYKQLPNEEQGKIAFAIHGIHYEVFHQHDGANSSTPKEQIISSVNFILREWLKTPYQFLNKKQFDLVVEEVK